MEEGQEGEMGLWDGKFQVPQGIVRTEEMDIVDTMDSRLGNKTWGLNENSG